MPLVLDREQLNHDLLRDEGLRLRPYLDTVGKLTVGIGHNLTDLGISNSVAWFLLKDDLYGTGEGSAKVILSLTTALPWWLDLSPNRQRALANMAYNMGIGTLLGFRTALRELERGNYPAAADAFLRSKWRRQVGDRALRVTDLIRNG